MSLLVVVVAILPSFVLRVNCMISFTFCENLSTVELEKGTDGPNARSSSAAANLHYWAAGCSEPLQSWHSSGFGELCWRAGECVIPSRFRFCTMIFFGFVEMTTFPHITVSERWQSWSASLRVFFYICWMLVVTIFLSRVDVQKVMKEVLLELLDPQLYNHHMILISSSNSHGSLRFNDPEFPTVKVAECVFSCVTVGCDPNLQPRLQPVPSSSLPGLSLLSFSQFPTCIVTFFGFSFVRFVETCHISFAHHNSSWKIPASVPSMELSRRVRNSFGYNVWTLFASVLVAVRSDSSYWLLNYFG